MFQIVIGPDRHCRKPWSICTILSHLGESYGYWLYALQLLTMLYRYWLLGFFFRKLLSICYTWQIGVVLFTYRPNTTKWEHYKITIVYIFEFQRVINMHPHKCRAKLLIINSLGVCKNIEFIVLVFKNLHPSSNSMSRKPHLTWNIYI